MQLSAGGVQGVLLRFTDARIDEGPAVVINELFECVFDV
jgi:hypothetical protein